MPRNHDDRWVQAVTLLLPLVPLLFLSLALAACSTEPETGNGTEPTFGDDQVHALDLDAGAVVEAEGPAREVFGFDENPIESVRSLAWTREGDILLADGARALLLLSDHGDTLQVLARPGEGPGEFLQLLSAAALSGGGAVYFDTSLNRVTELSGSYEVARLWRPEPALDPPWLFAPVTATPDGALLGTALSSPPSVLPRAMGHRCRPGVGASQWPRRTGPRC